MKRQFIVFFEIATNGAKDFGGNPVQARNERSLPFDHPIREIMAELMQLPDITVRIVITPDAVDVLAASEELLDHVKQLAEMPEEQPVQLSVGAKGGVFGYTVNEVFHSGLPGLPPIAIEELPA